MSRAKIGSLEWCTPQELGRRWNVSVNTVYRLLHEGADPCPAGKLQAMRIGTQLRVNIGVVEQYERRGKPQPASVAEIKQAIRGRRRAGASSGVSADHLGDL